MNPYFEIKDKIETEIILIEREYDPFPSDPLVVRVMKSSLAKMLDKCDHTDKSGDSILENSSTMRGPSSYCKLCQRHFNPDTLEITEDMNLLRDRHGW